MENPADEAENVGNFDAEISGNDTKETEKVPGDNRQMSFSGKLCLNVSVLAIVLAVINATALPSFMTMSVEEQPISAFVVTFIIGGFVTLLLSDFMPPRFAVLARTPIFAVALFWLKTWWLIAINVNGSTITVFNAAIIFAATMTLGFCVSRHATVEGKTPSTSARIEIFAWTTIGANLAALMITLLLSATFIGNVKGSIQAKIDSQVADQKITEYLWRRCPSVETKEFCDALKIVTSKR